MIFTDSHCHMVMNAFAEDRRIILDDYFASGGQDLMNISTSPAELAANLELGFQYDRMYQSLGWHPHDASDYTARSEETLLTVIRERKIQAVGEIGLDYHYDNSPRPEQIRAFDRQMAIAAKHKLPVIIHTREAETDTMEILRKYRGARGVLHCYTSGPELLKAGLDLDYYVSFSGILTFPRSTDLQELIRLVPIDRLLFETDAPYLAPVPHRGKRNDPRNVVHVIHFAAQLLDMDPDQLSDQACRNFRTLFGEPA